MLSNGGAWELLTLYEGNAFHCFLEAQRRTAQFFCCCLQPSNSWHSVPTHYWGRPKRRPRNWRRNMRSVSNTPRTLIVLRGQQSTVNTTSNVQYVTYKRNMRRFRFNIRCRRKAIRMIYSECTLVALVIQHAKLMQRTIMSSVACPELAYFSILSHKWHNVSEIKFFKIKLVPIFSTTFVWKSSHSKKNSARYCYKCIYIYICIHVKHTLFSSAFSGSYFREICRVGAEVFHTDRRTGKTKLRVAFRKFAKMPKMPHILRDAKGSLARKYFVSRHSFGRKLKSNDEPYT